MQDYKKIAFLGEGAHAEVYLVENSEGQKRALKIYTCSDEEYDEIKSNFLAEAVALFKISSKYVIKLFDFSIEGNSFTLLMEYCPFGSLKDQFKERGSFTLERTLKVGICALKGLRTLHEKEVIHRDIKPDNILLGEGGILKLADLGLAKEDREILDHAPRGTVAYMSPEQYTNFNETDQRSDIYSLGATLFHLYTGRQLFEGESITDVLESHQLQTTPALTEIVTDCPQSFNYVVRKMISKNPADRYQTAEEALEDMKACFEGALEIYDLPSINKIKQLALSTKPQLFEDDVFFVQENTPAKTVNSRKYIIGAAAVLLVSIILIFSFKKDSETPAKIASTEKNTIEIKPPAKPDHQEQDSLQKPKNDGSTAITKPVDIKKNIPPVIKKEPDPDYKFAGMKFSRDPFTLVKVDAAKNSCEFNFNDKIGTRRLTYKLMEDGLYFKVVKINPKDVICYNGKYFFKRILNKPGLIPISLVIENKSNKKILFKNFYQKEKGLEIIQIKTDSVTLKTQENKKINVKRNFQLSNKEEIFVDEELPKNIKDDSQPGSYFAKLISSTEKHIPFRVVAAESETITIEHLKSGRTFKHKLNDIIISRLQLKEFNQDGADFRDILTSKNYHLKKNEKFLLSSTAIISINDQLHSVNTGEEILGLKLLFKGGTYKLQTKEQQTLELRRNSPVVINKINAEYSKHTLKNCPCYVKNDPVNSDILSNLTMSWLLKNCHIYVARQSNNSRNPLAVLKWDGNTFKKIDNLGKIKSSTLTYFAGKLFYANQLMHLSESPFPFYCKSDNSSQIRIQFIPNSFKALKEVIAHCTLNDQDNQKTGFPYSLDEESEAIIINGIRYFTLFDYSKIRLVNTDILQNGKNLSLTFDNRKIYNTLKMKN